MAKDDISKLRSEIDALDRELLALINRRAALAQRIGALKQGAQAYRPEREAEILRRVAAENPGPLDADGVGAVFRELIGVYHAAMSAVQVSALMEDRAKVEIEVTAVVPA